MIPTAIAHRGVQTGRCREALREAAVFFAGESDR